MAARRFQGTPGATLKLTGFNFVRRSRVLADGVPMPYRRIGPYELDITLDANFLSRAGRFDVVVANPQPVDDSR